MLDHGLKVMSPSTAKERRLKQQHWEKVQPHVVPGWAASLNARRKAAADMATRLNASTWGAQGAQGYALATAAAATAAAEVAAAQAGGNGLPHDEDDEDDDDDEE